MKLIIMQGALMATQTLFAEEKAIDAPPSIEQQDILPEGLLEFLGGMIDADGTGNTLLDPLSFERPMETDPIPVETAELPTPKSVQSAQEETPK